MPVKAALRASTAGEAAAAEAVGIDESMFVFPSIVLVVEVITATMARATQKWKQSFDNP